MDRPTLPRVFVCYIYICFFLTPEKLTLKYCVGCGVRGAARRWAVGGQAGGKAGQAGRMSGKANR